MTILEAVATIFPEFQDPSWARWRALLRAMFGLPLEASEAAFIRDATGRDPRDVPAREIWLICGRRSGKSRIAALIAVYLAAFRTYRLAAGEVGVVMILATDLKQAQVIFRYVGGLVDGAPVLAASVIRRTTDTIEFANGTAIEVHVSSYKSVRGRTLIACLCDEIAFWQHEGTTNPDTEVLAAVRPALATTAGPLLCLTTAYARRGETWKAVQRPGERFVVRLPSLALNPRLDPQIIADAFADDPQAAAAEWNADFRSDLETFISRDVLDHAVSPERYELPPAPGVRYVAFVDPAGGSGGDSFTLAIAHRNNDRAVLDVVRERRPPHSPEQVVADYVALLKTYGVSRVTGDRYAGEWPREQFRKHGISYDPSAKTKSEIYVDLLPRLNSGRVELLDHGRLLAQLGALERRTRSAGRDSVDHPPGGHDDVANAAAGALLLALGRDPADLRRLAHYMARAGRGPLVDLRTDW